jgi:hypothetical protein
MMMMMMMMMMMIDVGAHFATRRVKRGTVGLGGHFTFGLESLILFASGSGEAATHENTA